MKIEQLMEIALNEYVPVLSSKTEQFGGKVDVDVLKAELDGRYLQLAADEMQTVNSDVAVKQDIDVSRSMRHGENMSTIGNNSFAGGEEGCTTGFRGYRVVDVDEAASTLTVVTPGGHATASPNTLSGIKAGTWLSFYARRCGQLELDSEPNFNITFEGVESSNDGKTKIKLSKIPPQLFANNDHNTPWFKCFNPADRYQHLVYVFFPEYAGLGQNIASLGAKLEDGMEYETSSGLKYSEPIDIDEPASGNSGTGSMSYGYQCTAGGDNSVAIGCFDMTLGRYSAAIGLNCVASGKNSFALGSANVAAGAGSIALGGSWPANYPADAMGKNVKNFATDAFAWSGTSRSGYGTRYEVPKDRAGTFNINPIGGLSGIYVGDESLASQVVDVSSNQDVLGRKRFAGGLVVGGDDTPDLGNSVLGVGSNLTVGANNWYWKCIDLSIDLDAASPSAKVLLTQTSCTGNYVGTFSQLSAEPDVQHIRHWMEQFNLPDEPIYKARVFLSKQQPKYPGPFVIFNGVSSVFRTCGYTIDINDESTYQNLSSSSGHGHLKNAWSNNYGKDYNRFSVEDIDTSKPASIKAALSRWMAEALTPEAGLQKYGLQSRNLNGQMLTIVNSEKTQYYRCMEVESVDNAGAVLTVDVKPYTADSTLNYGVNLLAGKTSKGAPYYLLTYGGGVCDVEPEDTTLVFVDSPEEPAPANTSTYGSVNIGEKNKVIRKCSLAAGKENACEGDFAVALGRKAHADHYASFVWAPAKEVHSPGSSTFTVGLNAGGNLKNVVKYDRPDYKTMYVGNGQKTWPMHRYMLACIIEELKHSKQMRDLLSEALASTANELSTVVAEDMN